MNDKPELTGFSKQLFECFASPDLEKQITALSRLEKQLPVQKHAVNYTEGENHD